MRKKRPLILIILDGWGIGAADESNPIHVVKPQNIDYLKKNFPAGILQASGISVGLPWGEEGNSEVGHLNLGAGKIIYQYYPQITLAIRDQSFFKNDVLRKAFARARENNSTVNLVGLLSEGNVHSSLEHLKALILLAEKEKVATVNLHLFSDGRDSRPNSVLELLSNLPKDRLASLSGRFYAMDRDNHWERTEKVYNVLTGNGPVVEDIEVHVKKTYAKNLNDEYIEPALISPGARPIKNNDSIIFFNFREDRMKQLVSCFGSGFGKFPVKPLSNIYIATMTPYDDKFKFPIAFFPEKIENPLGKIWADNSRTQLRIAETQKYPHVTYFFNGLREEPFQNEYRVLIPSLPISRPEEKPEMRAAEITNRLVESISEGVFDLILANFANPDMIAHTGNYKASLEAVRVIDEQIGKIFETCLKSNAFLIITSDHGNIERVFNPQTGLPETHHDPNPVPIYLVAKEFQREKTENEVKESEQRGIGILADVAPTILELVSIPKPKEMTGQSLLKSLILDY